MTRNWHISRKKQPSRLFEMGKTEQQSILSTKQPAAVSLEKDIVLKEDIVEEVEIETQPAAKKGPRLKRKIIVDERTTATQIPARFMHKWSIKWQRYK
jgi:hypothetical protein